MSAITYSNYILSGLGLIYCTVNYPVILADFNCGNPWGRYSGTRIKTLNEFST